VRSTPSCHQMIPIVQCPTTTAQMLAARRKSTTRSREAGVASAVYYGQPHHLQPVFRHLGYREGSLPVTEAASREGLALPMFPTLVEEQQREVVNAVRGAASAAA